MYNDLDPRQNRMLGALPKGEYATLVKYLEPYAAPQGRVLYEAGTSVRYVYFPISALVSLAQVMEDGASMEVAMVGNEGMIGASLLIGHNISPGRAIVSCEGKILRVSLLRVQDQLPRDGVFQGLVMRYVQALLVQISHTVACNQHHSLGQQLCRWLLQTQDRMLSTRLCVSQQQIANTLGVNREVLARLANKLQRDGLIEYHPGHIFVLDRKGLEARSCECYSAVKDEFERLLPPELSFS